MPSAPTRLSYSLIPAPSPKGIDVPPALRICVVYASGRTQYLRGNFADSTAAQQFIERFYPDLMGRNAPA